MSHSHTQYGLNKDQVRYRKKKKKENLNSPKENEYHLFTNSPGQFNNL